MRLMRASKGQTMAEYAVLFAIVIGAAIAMQQYVKSRLQGGIHTHADAYIAAAGGAEFEPERTTDSAVDSTSGLSMSSATSGTVSLTSNSNSTSTTTK